MRKTLTALLAAATLAGTAIATAHDASAGSRGGAVAAGIGLGILGGAIIGGAIANSRPAYGYPAYAPVEGYNVYPAYRAGPPVGCPGGYWARRPLFDGWGNQVGWSRPRFFCPY